MPYTRVRIHARGLAVVSPEMTITYEADGLPPRTRTLRFASPWFRHVNVEFDAVADTPQVTAVPTCAHNEKPTSLRCENLTFETVFDRAGVEITHSTQRSVVPLTGARGDEAWQTPELDAAMRKYWSLYADAPQWAIWVLFAGLGSGDGLMGDMFDVSDQTQRQGLAIFNKAFENDRNIPHGYPQYAEHLTRMRFFGLIHETGHCFNLHHGWAERGFVASLEWPFAETAVGTATFMHYPKENFFGRCYYEFHNSELKWLRHAPPHLIEMGDARFYAGANEFGRETELSASWSLGIGLPRARGVFEFLEPIVVDVTLTNVTRHPQIIDASVLEDADNLVLLVGCGCGVHQKVRRLRPFVRHCYFPRPRVVAPGDSLRTTCFVSADLDGWHLTEPGSYTLQATFATDSAIAVSPLTRLRIASPREVDEELIAQDLFTTDVGRAFAFGASYAIERPIETLREVLERLPQRAVARHAALTLAELWKGEQRVLRKSVEDRGFDRVAARPDEARRLMTRALLDGSDEAAHCFGERRYADLRQKHAAWIEKAGGTSNRTPTTPARTGRGGLEVRRRSPARQTRPRR
jgi:hypothetical protein